MSLQSPQQRSLFEPGRDLVDGPAALYPVSRGTLMIFSMHRVSQPFQLLYSNSFGLTCSERLKRCPSPKGVKPTLKHQLPQMHLQGPAAEFDA